MASIVAIPEPVTRNFKVVKPNDRRVAVSKNRKIQGIIINGQTYACASCKAGHRVATCQHGTQRPMKPTHPPGRPAAGAPKKAKCPCPRKCACTERDCKCDRDCSCLDTMYLLVYVPGPGEPAEYQRKPPKDEVLTGAWTIQREVSTDLKGNPLTDQEAAIRKHKQMAQEQQKDDTVLRSRTNSTSLSTPTPQAGGGCCKHRANVTQAMQTPKPLPQLPGSFVLTPNIHFADSKKDEIRSGFGLGTEPHKSPAPHVLYTTGDKSSIDSIKPLNALENACNCGTNCDCAFCPEHPNNTRTHNALRDHFPHLYQHNQWDSFNPPFQMAYTPSVPQDVSCMGGQPQFALSRQPQPQNPHLNGHYITYPISTHMLRSGITPNFDIGDGATSFDFVNEEEDPVGTLPDLEITSPDLSWLDPIPPAFDTGGMFENIDFNATTLPAMPDMDPLHELDGV